MPLIPSLEAHRTLKARMTFCSWEAGWRALLLRGYDDPPEVEELVTAATADHLLVLVTRGGCEIESFSGGRWAKAAYRPGSVGATTAGETARLRWRGARGHSTLQLHLPAAVLRSVAEEMLDGRPGLRLPGCLGVYDATVAGVLPALRRAAAAGAPDLYAETAAHFLAAHLLQAQSLGPAPPARNDPALRNADRLMRSSLAAPLSLGEMATAAGLGRYQFLRAARAGWGETPMRRLTRLRMERARELLRATRLPLGDVARACGYADAASFAAAFRRQVGATPSRYRRG